MDRADLAVSVTRGDTETIVSVSGELDLSTIDRLSESVNEELDGGQGHIVLDLAGLTFCDSMGLGTLVTLSKTARTKQRYLLVRNPSSFMTRMLEITGVRDELNIA